MKNTNHGVAPLLVVGIIAIAGALGFLVFKPKSLDNASRNAAASQVATANLNTAHEAEIAAFKNKSSSVAADVISICKVASTMPDTPARTAIVSETAIAQSKLEYPDPVELLAAEKRANAFLSGKLEDAQRLVTLAYKDSADLRDKVIAAETKVAKTEAARDAIDLKLSEAAAKALGAEQTGNRWKISLAVIALLYLYTKFTHLSPSALAEVATDIKMGKDGLTALDTATTRFQQGVSRFWQKHFTSN